MSSARRNLKEVRGQTSGLTNRNHIRQDTRIRLHNKLKANSYTEKKLYVVNVADRWIARYYTLPGEVLFSIPKVDREVNMEYKKSAEVVVVKRVSEN